MSAPTLVWKGINKKKIMDRLETQQMAAFQQIKPMIEGTLLATVGTRYYSLPVLRGMGSPYKHGGTPPMPSGVVNKQSGRFYRSIRVIGPTRIKSLVSIQVLSIDEERAWQLGGTERQIPRLYKALLQSRLRRQAARQLDTLTRSMIRIKVAA